jgi:[ribosomal protein S5]-alanine N-acetyltransferase
MAENERNHVPTVESRRTARLLLRRPTTLDRDFLTELFSRHELVAHRPRPIPDTPQESAARLTRDSGHWIDHEFGRLDQLNMLNRCHFIGGT